jgi:hypothetical protein
MEVQEFGSEWNISCARDLAFIDGIDIEGEDTSILQKLYYISVNTGLEINRE